MEQINDAEVLEDRFGLAQDEGGADEDDGDQDMEMPSPSTKQPATPDISIPSGAIVNDRSFFPEHPQVSTLPPAEFNFVKPLYDQWSGGGRPVIPEEQKARAESMGITLKPYYTMMSGNAVMNGYLIVGFDPEIVAQMTRHAHFNKYRKLIIFSKKEINRILDKYGV